LLLQEESEQGRIQGALYSLQAVASAIGPVAMQLVDNTAKKTSYLGPGTMFFFAASLQLIAVSFAYALPKDKANSRDSTDRATGLRRSFLARLDETDEDEDMNPKSSA
jgi:hypothetical protein